MGQLGADVEALDRAARTFDTQARHMRSTAAVVSRQVDAAWWHGGDAAALRTSWTSQHAPALQRIADALDERSEALRRQAEQQRSTSQGGGGAPSAPGPGAAPSGRPFAAVQPFAPADIFESDVVGPTNPYGPLPDVAELARLRALYEKWVTDETIDGKPVVDVEDADDFNDLANFANPDTVYRHEGYQWTTDSQGRVVVAEGTIELDPVGRNDSTLQRRIGNEGYETDVGFHLIADRFGAMTNRLNVVPGNGFPTDDGLPNLNNGAYSQFEDTLAELAEDHEVEVRISPTYADGNDTNRPDSFVVEYRVDGGRWIEDEFVNKH